MRGARLCSTLAAIVVSVGVAAPIQSETASDAAQPSSREILESAFAARYDLDLVSVIDLVARNGEGGERRRRFRATSKRIDDRVHSIGRLLEPEYLRGMTILTIEATDRSHDAFLYLPSMGRVRRITTAHRGDAIFGTDLTYEDLERQRAEAYDLGPARALEFQGEPAWLVPATPRRSYNYTAVEFVVAQRDYALLETRYFKRGSEQPFRSITASRDDLLVSEGRIVPTRLRVENRDRGTVTAVRLEQLQIDPEIDDRLFSIQALEAQRPLPRSDR
jgi:hypothetical protein